MRRHDAKDQPQTTMGLSLRATAVGDLPSDIHPLLRVLGIPAEAAAGTTSSVFWPIALPQGGDGRVAYQSGLAPEHDGLLLFGASARHEVFYLPAGRTRRSYDAMLQAMQLTWTAGVGIACTADTLVVATRDQEHARWLRPIGAALIENRLSLLCNLHARAGARGSLLVRIQEPEREAAARTRGQTEVAAPVVASPETTTPTALTLAPTATSTTVEPPPRRSARRSSKPVKAATPATTTEDGPPKTKTRRARPTLPATPEAADAVDTTAQGIRRRGR